MKSKILLPFVFGILFTFGASSIHAQHVEANIGIGYTAMDLDTWAGSGVADWDQTLYHVNIQGYTGGGFAQFGAELGYTHFVWYTLVSFSGERAPSATSVAGLLRLNLTDMFFTEFSAGMYFFGEFTDFGVKASAGLNLPLGGSLMIPIKFQVGGVLDSTTNLYPINFSAGVAYSF